MRKGYALLTSLLLVGACKDGPSAAPSTATSPEVPENATGTLADGAGEAAGSAPQHPAQTLSPRDGEGKFSSLRQLSFAGDARRPTWLAEAGGLAFVARADAKSCARLLRVDLEGRPLPPVRGDESVGLGGVTRWGQGLIASLRPKDADCETALRPWPRLDAAAELGGLGVDVPTGLDAGGFDGFPSASADGRVLAWVSTRSGDPEIWIRREGEMARRLTWSRGLDMAPSVSDDGQWVVWVANRPRGAQALAAWDEAWNDQRVPALPTDLWISRTDGTEMRRLTDFGAHLLSPQTRDGTTIWFTANIHDARRKDFDVYRMRLGGVPERMTTGPGFDGHAVVDPTSRKLAFVSDRDADGPRLLVATLDD